MNFFSDSSYSTSLSIDIAQYTQYINDNYEGSQTTEKKHTHNGKENINNWFHSYQSNFESVEYECNTKHGLACIWIYIDIDAVNAPPAPVTVQRIPPAA